MEISEKVSWLLADPEMTDKWQHMFPDLAGRESDHLVSIMICGAQIFSDILLRGSVK